MTGRGWQGQAAGPTSLTADRSAGPAKQASAGQADRRSRHAGTEPYSLVALLLLSTARLCPTLDCVPVSCDRKLCVVAVFTWLLCCTSLTPRARFFERFRQRLSNTHDAVPGITDSRTVTVRTVPCRASWRVTFPLAGYVLQIRGYSPRCLRLSNWTAAAFLGKLPFQRTAGVD